jgi:hypothetical protein
MSDSEQSQNVTEHVETTLIDIVQDAGNAVEIEGTPRLERVEVTDEKLANVRLQLREVQPDTE